MTDMLLQPVQSEFSEGGRWQESYETGVMACTEVLCRSKLTRMQKEVKYTKLCGFHLF